MSQQEQSNSFQEQGTMRLYGCGGGGINIVAPFSNQVSLRTGVAILKTSFVDTSRSNFKNKNIPENEIFIITDPNKSIDGSGKVRAENIEPIAKSVAKILLEHPPEDLNVVVFTASGGSGSVAGPLLVEELLRRGKAVACVVVGTQESDVTAENTFNTLKGLENTVNDVGRPVNMNFIMHTPEMSREAVNSKCRFVIAALAILGSRQNDELDSADLKRWLDYHTVPRANLPPQLTLINVYTDPDEAEAHSADTFAMACILKSPDERVPNMRTAYQCTGYLPADDDAKKNNYYFTSEVGGLNGLLSELKAIAAQTKEIRGARTQAASFVAAGDDDVQVKGNMVL